MRVGNSEGDQADEQRDGAKRVEVQPTPMSLAAKALTARFNRACRIGSGSPWNTLA
jgi:hypothetical protein